MLQVLIKRAMLQFEVLGVGYFIQFRCIFELIVIYVIEDKEILNINFMILKLPSSSKVR